MADSIEGEARFNYEQFTTGVEQMLRGLEKMQSQSAVNFDSLGKAAEAGIGKATKSLGDLNDKVQAVSLKAIQDQFKDLAGKINTKAFDDVVGKATNFDGALRRVNISAKLNETALAALGEQILGLNRELGTSIAPTAAVGAQMQIMRSGFKDTAESMEILRAAFLIAGNESDGLSIATNTLTQILHAYGESAAAAAGYSDILARATSLGAGSTEELNEAFAKAAPTAAALGIKGKEVAAALSLLGENGTKGAQAGTEITRALVSLSEPTAKAQAAFDRLNISIDAQTLKADGLAKTLSKVVQAAKKSGDAEAILIDVFGRKGGIKIGQILGGSDGNALADQEAKFANAGGAAAARQKELAKILENQAKATAVAFQELAIQVGTELLPVAQKFADVAKFTVDVLDLVPKPVFAAGVALAGMAGGLAALGGTISGIGILIPAIAGGMSKLVGLLGGFVGAAPALVATGEAAAAAGAAAGAAEVGMSGFLATAVSAPAIIAALAASLGVLALAYGAVSYAQLEIDNKKIKAADDRLDKTGVNKDGINVFKGAKNLASAAELASGSTTGLFKSGKATTGDYDKADNELKNELAKKKQRVKDLKESLDQFQAPPASFGGEDRFGGAPALRSKDDIRNELDQAVKEQKDAQKQLEKLRSNRLQAIKLADEKKRNPTGSAGPLLSPDQLRKLFANNANLYAEKREDILDNEDLSPRKKAEMLTQAGFRYGKARDREGNLDAKAERARRKEISKLNAQADKSDFADSLQEVKTSKDTHAEKIARLQELAAAHKGHADRLRQINADIAKEEKAAEEDHRKSLIETAKIRQEQQQAVLKGLQTEEAELEKLAGRGANNLAARQSNLDKQAQARVDIVRAKSNQELGQAAKIDDPVERGKAEAAIKAKDRTESADINAENNRRKEELSRKQAEADKQRAAELTKTQADFQQRRIDLLKEEASAGKDVQSQLRQAVQDKLALQEKEILQQADIQKANNDKDPLKIAQIELQAQAQIIDAGRAAKAEIDAGTEAWNKQKAAREAAQESGFGKNPQSFEEFLKENNAGNSAVDALIKRNRAETGKDSAFAGNSGLPGNLSESALNAAARDLNDKAQSTLGGLTGLRPNLAAAARSLAQGPLDSNGQPIKMPEVPLAVKVELVVKDSQGRETDHDAVVTIGGRNGRLATAARGMSGSRGLGGY